MIAALYVDPRGVYAGRADVEVWDIARDARTYTGPWPVVAHPPCQRWGRWWWADGSTEPGGDGGCFAAALACVDCYGGVIEHPAYSHAWAHFGLPVPSADGGWNGSLLRPGYSAHVEQVHYGHRARKATWLFCVGAEPPPLRWGAGVATAYLCPPGRRGPHAPGRLDVERIGAREARSTPHAFAELLTSIARSCARGAP